MGWLDDVLRRGRDNAIPADHPLAEVEAVTFPGGERPSWAAHGTGLYRALDETLRHREPLDAQPPKTVAGASAEPLPRRRARAAKWRTRQGDEVTVGDLVALSVLGADGRDAKGRIVGAAGDGVVECVLGDHDDPNGKRPRLHVDEDNLVMLLRKAGGDGTYDAKRL